MHLPGPGSVEQVLVFPRSGFINRFQTLASTWILARQLHATPSICWMPCPFVSGPAEESFSEEFCRQFVVTEQTVRERFGLDMDAVPRYVSHHASDGWIGLRGHDRGEQALLDECLRTIDQHAPVRLLVIVAGGSFYVPSEHLAPAEALIDFQKAKRDFYRSIPLNPAIEGAVKATLDDHADPYLGLHLRYTDRTHQAPFPRSIRNAVTSISAETGIRRLFVASDSGAARRHWYDEARRLGLEPWSFDPTAYGVTGAHAALIDWRLLGNAERLVYFRESSYSAEAAIASGNWQGSIGLGANPLRSAVVRAGAHVQAAWRRASGDRAKA